MSAEMQAQAEALLKDITPGEWYAYTHIDGTALYSPRTPRPNEHFAEGEEPVHLIAENMGSVDAELCRNAPTLARQVVELAEEVERLRAENAALRRGQDSGFITLHRPFPPRKRIEDLPISKPTQEAHHDD